MTSMLYARWIGLPQTPTKDAWADMTLHNSWIMRNAASVHLSPRTLYVRTQRCRLLANLTPLDDPPFDPPIIAGLNITALFHPNSIDITVVESFPGYPNTIDAVLFWMCKPNPLNHTGYFTKKRFAGSISPPWPSSITLGNPYASWVNAYQMMQCVTLQSSRQAPFGIPIGTRPISQQVVP